MRGGATAQEARPAESIIGIADVERVLRSYRRADQVKAELEHNKTSESHRQKQAELEKLEREAAGRRFWFSRPKASPEEMEKKRGELKAMIERDAQSAREREKGAMEELLAEVRDVIVKVGGEERLALVFDSNAPQILFLNPRAGGIEDISDAAVERLNSGERQQ